jgi:hypothetical protein
VKQHFLPLNEIPALPQHGIIWQLPLFALVLSPSCRIAGQDSMLVWLKQTDHIQPMDQTQMCASSPQINGRPSESKELETDGTRAVARALIKLGSSQMCVFELVRTFHHPPPYSKHGDSARAHLAGARRCQSCMFRLCNHCSHCNCILQARVAVPRKRICPCPSTSQLQVCIFMHHASHARRALCSGEECMPFFYIASWNKILKKAQACSS